MPNVCTERERNVVLNMKKKTVIAALIMVGALLISLPLGVNHSLGKERKEAQDVFMKDEIGFSIFEEVGERRDAAENLLTVARRYVEAEPELQPYMDELETQIKACTGSMDDLLLLPEANRKMGQAAQTLADQLSQTELSERDEKYPKSLMALMDSEQDKIQRSAYNDMAREYNEKLEKFPVSVLRYVSGVKPLEAFD